MQKYVTFKKPIMRCFLVRMRKTGQEERDDDATIEKVWGASQTKRKNITIAKKHYPSNWWLGLGKYYVKNVPSGACCIKCYKLIRSQECYVSKEFYKILLMKRSILSYEFSYEFS